MHRTFQVGFVHRPFQVGFEHGAFQAGFVHISFQIGFVHRAFQLELCIGLCSWANACAISTNISCALVLLIPTVVSLYPLLPAPLLLSYCRMNVWLLLPRHPI